MNSSAVLRLRRTTAPMHVRTSGMSAILSEERSGEAALGEVNLLKRKPQFSPRTSASCPDLQSLCSHDSGDHNGSSLLGQHPLSTAPSHLFSHQKIQRLLSPSGIRETSARDIGEIAGMFALSHGPSLPPTLAPSPRRTPPHQSTHLRCFILSPSTPRTPVPASLLPSAPPPVSPIKPGSSSRRATAPPTTALQELRLRAQNSTVTSPSLQLCDINMAKDPAFLITFEKAMAGLKNGQSPVPATDCVSGVYYLPNQGSGFSAIFKPTDEEVVVKGSDGLALGGCKQGEAAIRECMAFVVDKGMAGVPPTGMIKAFGIGTKTMKIGALQTYVNHECSAEDLGPSLFPIEDVQKIACLDIRICNQDRHVGNILVQRLGSPNKLRLVPIDHGFCFPHPLHMEQTFDWLSWPQVRKPITEAIKNEILAIDIEADVSNLQRILGHNLPKYSILSFRIGTLLLQKGADAGLSLYDIGKIMVRETPDFPSMLENAIKACTVALGGEEKGLLNHPVFIKMLSPLIDDLVKKMRAV